jgi:hypothetical protein
MMTSAVLFLTLFLIISMHTITSVVATTLEHQAITLEEAAAAAPNTSTRNSTSTTTTRERVAAAELEIMMGTRAAAHGRDGQRRLLQHVFGRSGTSRRRPLKLVQSIRRRRRRRRSRLQQEQQLPGRRRLEDHSGAAGDKKGFGSMFGSNYRLIPTGPDPLHN